MALNIKKQSQWWKYVGGTVPVVCLAIIVILDLVNWSHIHNQLLGFLLLCFFTVGVLWWWWAVDKIIELVKLLMETETKFAEIKDELKKIKNEVKLIDNNQDI